MSFVPGENDMTPVLVPNELKSIISVGKVIVVNKFAGLTGLNVKHVMNMGTHKILKVFQYGLLHGQSKLSRLVKGCLLYLDHLEKGPTKYHGYGTIRFGYNVTSLVETLEYEDSAYVFTSNDGSWSNSTNAILYGMCESYPHPNFGGCAHITIPADATNLFLVGYSAPTKLKSDIFLFAELIWGRLCIMLTNLG